jgi:hypothetical protein
MALARIGRGMESGRVRVLASGVSRPSDLCLAIHGPTAACHELHAAPGSFAAAVGALSEARAQGRRVWVASWLTRSSCRSLVALVDLLVGYGVAGWAIAWPRVHDVAAAGVARTVPRLGIAVPHALRAVERAARRGLPTVVVGAPSCVLGPFAAQGLRVGEAGAFVAACDGCPSRTGCAGIEPWYLDRFGAQELRPVPAVMRGSWPEGVAEGLVAAVVELEAIA